MRSRPILSTPPRDDADKVATGAPFESAAPLPRPAPGRHPGGAAAARPRGAVHFEVCQTGVVLRTVLVVEAAVAIGTLYVSEGAAPWFSAWLLLAATVTGGALPATLAWLVGMCTGRRLLARWPLRGQYAAGLALGAAAGLYACALLRLAGAMAEPAWAASALSGALLAAAVMAALLLRASAHTPAATTARLEELQQRIRPHFLFNTLNSAIALVRHDPAKAETMLEDLSELFRSALAEPDEPVTLADEIALAERYLAIEQIRFGDRLRVRWSLDPAAASARLPKLLLQPLVENAVKHGVEPSPQGGHLRIRTERRGSQVVIEVVNSLPPLRWADEPLPRGHGIALANVRDRLRLLHDMQARFSAGPEGDSSYRVRIDIPAEP